MTSTSATHSSQAEEPRLDMEEMSTFVDLSVSWIVNYPIAARQFSTDGANLLMRAVGLHIDDVDKEHLPAVMRSFVDAIPAVVGDLINKEGRLKLRDMAATMHALAFMDASFWLLNPVLRSDLIKNFPPIHAWVVLVGEMVIHDRYIIHGEDRRRSALQIFHNVFWVLRKVGEPGISFIKDRSLWKDAISIWGRTADCTFVEESKMAALLLHASETFNKDLVNSFSQAVLSTLHNFDAKKIINLTVSRGRRAIVDAAEDEAYDFFVVPQLFSLRVLIDDPTFSFDESPFHSAFFEENGLIFVLETMTHCVQNSCWSSMSVCVTIVAAFLGRARSLSFLRFAMEGRLIGRLTEVCCHANRLTNRGKKSMAFLLKQLLPEVLWMKSFAELAYELKVSSPEMGSGLARSEYNADWRRLNELRGHYYRAYQDIESKAGREDSRCSNIDCVLNDSGVTQYKRCSKCKMFYYCSDHCQKEGWGILGHKRECKAYQCVQDELRMTPDDLRFFMLIVQKRVQVYMYEVAIKVTNVCGFLVHYDAFVKEDYPRWFRVPVSQIKYVTDPSAHVLDLPDTWQAMRGFDVRAVVKVSFTRLSETYSFAFRSGFRAASGIGGLFEQL